MSLARLQLVRRFHRSWQPLQPLAMSRSNLDPIATGTIHRSIITSTYTIGSILERNRKDSELVVHYGIVRSMSTAAQPTPPPSTQPPSTQSIAKMQRGSRQVVMKVAMLSPGFIYEPYKPREPISFWRRWFTLNGWRRTKEDMVLELKSAYAINRLRKATGYSKKLFY